MKILGKLQTTDTATVTNLNADTLDGNSSEYFAPKASPTFTGTVSAQTATLSDVLTLTGGGYTTTLDSKGYAGLLVNITGTTASAVPVEAFKLNPATTKGFLFGNELLTTANLTDAPTIPTTLPASDVYAWAKAATKPSYAYSEITGTIPTFNQNTTGNAATAANALRALDTTKSSYGSVEIYGATNGWSGIRFDAPSSVFMVNNTNNSSGLFKENATWVWQFNKDGALVNGTVPWASVTDTPTIPTTLPASDVYDWAKAATKPSYAYSEITSTPTIPTVSAWAQAATKPSYAYSEITGNVTDTLTIAGGAQINGGAQASITIGAITTHRTLDVGGALSVGGSTTIVGGTYSTTWAKASDDRLKTRIVELTNVLPALNALTCFSYTYNGLYKAITGQLDTRSYLGLSAQELSHVFPETVVDNTLTDTEGNSYLGVSYEALIPVIIQAIKELTTAIEDLKIK